ncbi:MAG: DUF1566 domain-containing protein [Methylococcus sp.]|nr:DUF1566 domain-containing protein [Methylococcus sp.]
MFIFLRFLPLLVALPWAMPVAAVFTDNGDGTVTDEATGLMWDQCSWGQGWDYELNTCRNRPSTHSWDQALAVAASANSQVWREYTGWRLPNAKELESLVDISKNNPAIDTAVFPFTPATGVYWSSTSFGGDPARAWYVSFETGSVLANSKATLLYVRLVRGGRSFADFDAFLPAYTLTVTPSTGGVVTSEAGGIDCGVNCSASFASGSNVVLTAAPAAGYTFSSWSGCVSSSASCSVTMNGDKTVSATFVLAASPSPTVAPTPGPTTVPTPIPADDLWVMVVGNGGRVTSKPVGIDCGTVCAGQFTAGSPVYLTATPKPGSVFVDWVNCDSIQPDKTCRMSMTGPKLQVIALFREAAGPAPTPAPSATPMPTATPAPNATTAPTATPAPTTQPVPVPTPTPSPTPAPTPNRAVLNVVTLGEGAVIGSAGGIECGPVCSASFDVGSAVTLTAVPAQGYRFKRWIGAGCAGKKPCTVKLTQSKTVTAKFIKKK